MKSKKVRPAPIDVKKEEVHGQTVIVKVYAPGKSSTKHITK